MSLPTLCSTLFPYTTLFRSLTVVVSLMWPLHGMFCCTFSVPARLLTTIGCRSRLGAAVAASSRTAAAPLIRRSEEHTSELQSRFDLVCRLLLEKKTCAPAAP